MRPHTFSLAHGSLMHTLAPLPIPLPIIRILPVSTRLLPYALKHTTALSATPGCPPLLNRRDSDLSCVSVAVSSALPLLQLQNEIRSNLDDLRVIKAELRGAANMPPGITRSSHPGSKSSCSIRNHNGSPTVETSGLQWLQWLHNLGGYKGTPDD